MRQPDIALVSATSVGAAYVDAECGQAVGGVAQGTVVGCGGRERIGVPSRQVGAPVFAAAGQLAPGRPEPGA
jgi:hypothetical protein